MPKGPRGEKRPADVIGNAVKVMRIATGEETEELDSERAKSAAAELGSRGGARSPDGRRWSGIRRTRRYAIRGWAGTTDSTLVSWVLGRITVCR
jgi:hypothetical protein